MEYGHPEKSASESADVYKRQGADLGCVRQVSEVRILQGRNSVDDVDYFDNTVLEYSVDRKEWKALTEMCIRDRYKAGNDQAFWEGYVNHRMSKEDVAAYEKHKSGTMVLQPFYEQSMDDMASGFFKKLTGDVYKRQLQEFRYHLPSGG